jgi:hypothetical protein
VVAWAALAAWAVTAGFGLNLAIRGGAIRFLMRTPFRRMYRQGWSHRTLFLGHVGFAVTGLTMWILYTLANRTWAGWLALGLLTVVAAHGLSLVERWIPGHGRHSTGRSVDHTRRGYFPILAATGHVMAASATVILVLVTLLRGVR